MALKASTRQLTEVRADSSAPDWQRGAAHVDGVVVPMSHARMALADSAIMFSDAVFDVVAAWNGSFFRLADHQARFEEGCRKLRLKVPYSTHEISGILADLVARTELREAFVAFMCTRGVSTDGERDVRRFQNRFYAYAIPYVWLLAPEDRLRGMNMIIAQSVRRIPPSAVDPTIKNFNRGDFTRGMLEAHDRGAEWPILLDQHGNVTEGSGYNVVALIDDTLVTPASGVLEGITRRTVTELCASRGIAAELRSVSEGELRAATELFATSTSGGIMPVTRLDGEPVGDGSAGPVTREIIDLYWGAHEDPRYLTEINYT